MSAGEWTGTARDGLVDMTVEQPPIYLPNDLEMMAARGAIVSLVDSVARGNLEPRREVLDGIILSVVRSLGWRPTPISVQASSASGGQTKQFGPRPRISTKRPPPQ